jgi:hypothetical protein
MPRPWLALAFVAAALFAAPAPAEAQYRNPFTGNTFNNPISSSLDTMIMHSIQRQTLLKQLGAKKAPAAKAAPAKHQPLAATDFVRVDAGRPAVKAFLAQAKLPAETQAALMQIVDATFATFERDWRKDNVA